MYVLDKNDKKQIPPGGIGTRAQDFRKTKTHHTTTQHATLHPSPICSTASLFPVSLSSCLVRPHPSATLVLYCIIVLCCTMLVLYHYTIVNLYIIYYILILLLYLYYIYISILLVYLPIHYYIAILFYNQYSILYYNSISIYLFYCRDLCIYISILFIYVCAYPFTYSFYFYLPA